MDLKELQSPVDIAPEQQRRGGDRRKQVIRSLVYGSFHPRLFR